MIIRNTLFFSLLTIVSSSFAADDGFHVIQRTAAKKNQSVQSLNFFIHNETQWCLQIDCIDEANKIMPAMYVKSGESQEIPFRTVKAFKAIAPVSTYGYLGCCANSTSLMLSGFTSRWRSSQNAEAAKRYYTMPNEVDIIHFQNAFEKLKQELISENIAFASIRIIEDNDQELGHNLLSFSCCYTAKKLTDQFSNATEEVPKVTILPKEESPELILCDQIRTYFKDAKQHKEDLEVLNKVLLQVMDQEQPEISILRSALSRSCDLLRIKHDVQFDVRIECLLDDSCVESQARYWNACIDVVQEAMSNSSIAALMHQEDIEAFVQTVDQIVFLMIETADLVEGLLYKYQELLQL